MVKSANWMSTLLLVPVLMACGAEPEAQVEESAAAIEPGLATRSTCRRRPRRFRAGNGDQGRRSSPGA